MGERDKKIILVKMDFEKKQLLIAEGKGDIEKVRIHKKNLGIYEKQLKELEHKEGRDDE